MSAESFYSRFKDRVSSSVQKRGADLPKWDDVLLVATDFPETRHMLTDQDISTSGLRRDILYSLHFGRPQPLLPGSGNEVILPFQDLHSRAVMELQRDVDEFRKSQEYLNNPANHNTTEMFLEFFQTYLSDRERLVNDPEGFELGQYKMRILGDTLAGFVEQFTPIFKSPEGVSEDQLTMIQEANRGFMADVMDQFGRFTYQKSTVTPADQPGLVLAAKDQAEADRGDGISPFKLVDITLKAADPFLTYLVHRNGLMAPDDYEPPFKMPHPLIIEHGLEALDYAREIRERVVKPVHLLPSLLEDSTVLYVVMELDEEGKVSESEEAMSWFGEYGGKIRNFIKFHEAIRESIKPKTQGERFRYRVKTTEEIRAFLLQAEGVVAEGGDYFAEARMVRVLYETDPEAKEALLNAGLTEEQLKKWPDAIQELAKKREEAKKRRIEPGEEKKEIDFKISDRQLKDLLEEYSVDLTKLALEGKVDPVIGRNSELVQMMRILLQRGRSNPLLIGEPGVGKTALFDGLAHRIASGNAPKSLIGAKVVKLDLSEMNSGAMYRGQFEGRLLPIIQGVAERNAKGDKPPIILCIDELHAALQAGSAQGTPDASQLLKPYLTRGDLSIVGTTTQRDYAKYIALDSALDRRFQTIFVGEPGYEDTLDILRGVKNQYTNHHQLEIDDALLDVLVKLSTRYLPNQQQPDKAIRVLDAACARAKMQEKESVEMADVIETIAAEAKIKPEFLLEGEEAKFLRLTEELPKQVLGQPEATAQIANALITAKADLQDPRKPLGVFMLLGPTGVGKTETGRALSRLLHGSEENMIRIDMSDYKEAHEASKLFGAPPGYVGYGEEGLLTGAVRRQPYSVVVLDEVEKADPKVLDRLLPIFEEGEITDGRGQKISFRNTVVLMTSNLGAQSAVAEAESQGINPRDNLEEWQAITHPIYDMVAKQYFRPEFLNRVDGRIVYNPLTRNVIDQLVDTEINKLSARVKDRFGLSVKLGDNVGESLAELGYNPEYGARELKRVVMGVVGQPLARWLLERRNKLIKGGSLEVTGIGSNFKVDTILVETETS